MNKDKGAPASPSGHSAEPEPVPVSALRASVLSADVAAVVAELTRFFGPGFSNGVVALLSHDKLPAHFGRECWKDWAFRPAPKAFDWAHEHGLIVPWKLSRKWAFTDLGKAVAAHYQAASEVRDSECAPTPEGQSS